MFILFVFLEWGANAPPVRVDTYPGIVACEAAGHVWDAGVNRGASRHHVCVPAP